MSGRFITIRQAYRRLLKFGATAEEALRKLVVSAYLQGVYDMAGSR